MKASIASIMAEEALDSESERSSGAGRGSCSLIKIIVYV